MILCDHQLVVLEIFGEARWTSDHLFDGQGNNKALVTMSTGGSPPRSWLWRTGTLNCPDPLENVEWNKVGIPQKRRFQEDYFCELVIVSKVPNPHTTWVYMCRGGNYLSWTTRTSSKLHCQVQHALDVLLDPVMQRLGDSNVRLHDTRRFIGCRS